MELFLWAEVLRARLTKTGPGTSLDRKVRAMKALIVLTAALGIAMTSARAQTPAGQPKPAGPPAVSASDQQADLLKNLPDLPTDEVERLISLQSRTLRTVLGVNLEYTGMLPELERVDHPLQLLNPFAPASYGNGYDTLGSGFRTEHAPGFVVFAIRF